MCICVCKVDSIFWGDNGSGENVYNSIYVFSGTNGNNTYVDQWTPSTIEKKIQLKSGTCQVGHSIYTARLYFILRTEQGRHTDLPLQENENVNPIEGLPRYIRWLKTMTTNKYIDGVNEKNWEPFYQIGRASCRERV